MDNRPSANFNDALTFDRQCFYKKLKVKSFHKNLFYHYSAYDLTMGVYEIIHPACHATDQRITRGQASNFSHRTILCFCKLLANSYEFLSLLYVFVRSA